MVATYYNTRQTGHCKNPAQPQGRTTGQVMSHASYKRQRKIIANSMQKNIECKGPELYGQTNFRDTGLAVSLC